MNPATHNHGILEMTLRQEASDHHTVLCHLFRQTPIIVQQALYFDQHLPTMACVYILSSGGPIIEGDLYNHIITLLPHAQGHISTSAATKIASMQGGNATQMSHIHLHEHSYLEWLPEPTIPCRGADFRTHTTIHLAPSATLFWAECYTPGRTHFGEHFSFRNLDLCVELVELGSGRLLCLDHSRIVPAEYHPTENFVLDSWPLWASVLMAAPRGAVERLYDRIGVGIEGDVATAVGRMEEDRGLVVRLAGRSLEALQGRIRGLCSLLRTELFGCPLTPTDFPWR